MPALSYAEALALSPDATGIELRQSLFYAGDITYVSIRPIE